MVKDRGVDQQGLDSEGYLDGDTDSTDGSLLVGMAWAFLFMMPVYGAICLVIWLISRMFREETYHG